MLNLPDALEVYEICKEYIDDDEVLSDKFASLLLSRIDTNKCSRLIELFSDASTAPIDELDQFDLVGILINGLNKNEIRSLYAFCKEIL